MEPIPTERHDIRKIIQFYEPSRFGFERYKNGWKLSQEGQPDIIFSPLTWAHAQVNAGHMNALELFAYLQKIVWDDPEVELVAPEIMGIVPNTGGATIVAYEDHKGFYGNKDDAQDQDSFGYVAFTVGFGAASRRLTSHLTGVRPDLRGQRNIGWYMKVLQGYEAAKTGHDAMEWTYDPMLGLNAKLNIAKLGGKVRTFTVDKYGVNTSGLYATTYSDRFTLEWDFGTERVQKRISEVSNGTFAGTTLEDVADIPVATAANIEALIHSRVPEMKYSIPGDVSILDPKTTNEWRADLRHVFTRALDSQTAAPDSIRHHRPEELSVVFSPGDYEVMDFATGNTLNEETGVPTRESYYILARK